MRPCPWRALLVGIAAVALLGACAQLPEVVAKTPSHAIADTANTRLGRALAPLVEAHPGQAGVRVLPDGHDGFAARMVLAAAAERSIDVQTYIWHGDATGMLLFDQMPRAAQRGVRVRLLIDDFNTQGLDPLLALLASEPNLALRLFNPHVARDRRALGALGDFERLNRRMHNKSFTVDNQVSIIGGRNIGDEYFAAHPAGNFIDMEVLVVGKTPAEISTVFDQYWNSPSAYPAAVMLEGVVPMAATEFSERVAALKATPAAAAYVAAVETTPLANDLQQRKLRFDWATATLIFDDPKKVRVPPGATELQMLPRLLAALGTPQHALDLVSPYFVPDSGSVLTLTGLAHRGVKVRVLTNSLAATDVISVHAGYAKRREALLQGGVQLFELKPAGSAAKIKAGRPPGGSAMLGGSRTSVHAKVFSADRERLFVGSFNLDPRSEHLNTEMGLVIYSPRLAGQLSTALDEALREIAYALKLSADGQVKWFSDDAPPQDVEPQTGARRRFIDSFIGLVPIDWLL